MAINPDGKFIITNGGITQGIKRELGLSGEECQILKQNSVWDQIINEFEGETNGQKNMTVTDNKNDTPNKSNNFLVHPRAVIEFSKDCWKRIVDLVNNALNKNIQTAETVTQDNTIQPSAEQTITDSPTADSKDFDEKVNQAKEAILQNIENLELADEDINKIKGFLQQFTPDKVPPEVKNNNTSLSEAAFQLISQAVGNPNKAIIIVSQLINSCSQFEDVNINDEATPQRIKGKKISELANDIQNNTPDKIQSKYNQAQERLREYLASNPDKEFSSPYDSSRKIKASELLKYINNVKYDDGEYGAAQAYDFIPDDGINERNGILINTNKLCCDPYLSDADAIKILIHESLHCAFSTEHFAFNNQQEEMFCERQAIQLTSAIVNNGSEIEDIQSTYGITYSEFNTMNDAELTEFLKSNFINKGYEHRPKNTDGDVNINGHEVMHGDIVFLNGKQIGIIGTQNGRMQRESCILDQLDRNNINMMIPNGAGRVVFADTPPNGALPLKIKRGDDKVFSAYFIPNQPN